MSEVKNIPQLRFPLFSDEWKKKRFSDFISYTKGFAFKSNDYQNEGERIVRVSDLGYDSIKSSNGIYFDKSKVHSVEKYLIQEGDIIVTTVGSRPELIDSSVGRGILVRKNGEGFLNQNLVKINEIERINNRFLFGFFNTKKYFNYITQIQRGNANQSNITLKDFFNYQVNIPSLNEQQKIADFLTSVDKRIELLEKKKTLLETYKKGVMKKIFNQEIRFRENNCAEYPDWKKFKLNQVLFEHKERNTESKFDEVFSVSKHKGVVNQIEHLGRSYSAKTIDHYKLINNWDVVYTKSPTSDFPFGIIKQNTTGRTGVLSPLYGVFKPKNKWIGKIIASYFESWVNTYNYLVPLVQKGAKNTMNINNDTFLDGKEMSLPTSENEQEKISKFLLSIENQIELLETQIDKSKTWKKGLLQKMFV